MNTHLLTRRLIPGCLLLAALGIGQVQASETPLLAEGGSDRVLEQGRKQQQTTEVELAEIRNESSVERARTQPLTLELRLAEGGAERTLAARRG